MRVPEVSPLRPGFCGLGTPTSVLQDDGAAVTASIYLRAANTPQTLTINILNNSASGPTTISTLNAAVTTTWQRFDLPPGTNANGLTALEMNMGSSSNSQFVSTNPIYIVSVGQRP